MISEWKLGNFKSVGDVEPFSFRPLTVFAGPNSSGKSSVLQSILLIAQTLGSQVSQRQLVLNGDVIKLGTFEDVRCHSSESPDISIGFTLRPDSRATWSPRGSRRYSAFPYYPSITEKLDKISADLTFGPSEQDHKGDAKARSLQARLLNAAFTATLASADDEKSSSGLPSTQTLTLKKRDTQEIASILSTLVGSVSTSGRGIDERVLEYEIKLIPESVRSRRRSHRIRFMDLEGDEDLVAAHLDHFLPTRIITSINAIRREVVRALAELMELPHGQRLRCYKQWLGLNTSTAEYNVAHAIQIVANQVNQPDFLFLQQLEIRDSVLRAQSIERITLITTIAFQAAGKARGEKNEKKALETIETPEVIGQLSFNIAEAFSSLRYLGPLRDDPKPVYAITSSADPSDVGVKGEYTAAVLDLYATQMVDFIAPMDYQGMPTRCSLQKAVLSWLEHFDIADSYSTKEEGKLGHRLLVRPKGGQAEFDLTNVGVGVSQVLPIIVMALISDPGAILLFEQPELHLHPKVQSLLGDFFLAVIRTGRQCIIETHSEYLINRLRLRVAESSWDADVQNKIVIYFVERADPLSRFRKIFINPYGSIPEWPPGFFDQGPTESDRILRASAEKKRKKPKA